MKRGTIIVFGMGRSGTSCLTNLCCAAGWWAGYAKDMTGHDQFNKLGYWERKDVSDLNSRICREAGVDIFSASEPLGETDKYDLNIQTIISKMHGADGAIIKQPKFWITWQIWKKHFPKVRMLRISRKWEHIAKSWNYKKGIPQEYVFRTMRIASRAIKNHMAECKDNYEIEYDDLFFDNARLNGLGKWLGYEDDFYELSKKIIRSGLNHEGRP